MTTLEIIDVVTKLLGLISIIFAGIALWQSSRYARRQWNLDAFTYYTEKYERIMSSFPKNAYMYRFEIDKQIQSNEEIRLAALRYLNLTSEEYYLWKDHYISNDVWKIWKPEIIRTLQTPLFVREWQTLRHEFKSYPAFSQFVDRIQAETTLIFNR
ncbi:MAG: hypothetical protein KME15_28385 [Drouetiella hepatica Uher 2000/2452]|jgi:hypothetical protein|uniref:DUF4760 domain-containing protein n=1 Tax=Drouetiella hepatica Uher 2000/2452 TaxID=904376 RepID=A0A951QH88_9CYAN|nr:hypothetical protein [Drouetiella hepatica Uher 2000/2452]